MDIAVMIFVVLCMILESFSLSLTLDMMVVKPIERMQGHVRMMAKVFFPSLMGGLRKGWGLGLEKGCLSETSPRVGSSWRTSLDLPSDTKLLLTKNYSKTLIFEKLRISRVIP